MSHFTVMVIGSPDTIDEQMIPFQEHACTGKCPKEYLKFEDAEEEYLKNYETDTTREFYCASNSSWGMVVGDKIFDLIANANEGDRVRITFDKSDVDMGHYWRLTDHYDVGRKQKTHKCPTERKWVQVVEIVQTNHPDKDVCFEGTIILQITNPPREYPVKTQYLSFEEYMEKYVGYKERDPETGRYGRWENPNAKWDWYQVGGRWAGKLLIKPEFHDLYREQKPNFSWGYDVDEKGQKVKEEILKEVRVDSAKKCHVDWDRMMQEAGLKAGKTYDIIQEKILKDTPPNEIWEVFRDQPDGREKYWAQPRCQRWNEVMAEEHKKEDGLDLGWHDSPDDFLVTREQYVKEAERQAISTFAVLKDGKWAEKGQMGWFACVSNENDSWPEVFYNILQTVKDEEYVTIVDCHI